ncbi:MAG TPA: rhomboid family intramembrane serine protease [Pirellulaceae bacterium]|nr:rhomboid family intramembrane serine protease [Pirellulaceae bacterium]
MVFPLSDDNSDRTQFPVVTVSLIVINVLVFVLLQGAGMNEGFTMAFSTVPKEIVTGTDLVTLDRQIEIETEEGPQTVTAPGLKKTPVSVYLTLLTSMFMHGSIMHIAGNMWFLWIFGDNIEQDLGRIRYVLFYLLAGLLASLTHVLFNASGPSAEVPSLGASGAISGVMGAYLVLHPHRRVTVLLFRFVTQVPGYVAVGIWFAFQIVSGWLDRGQGGVAYGAHIGGFIAGAALAFPFMLGRPRKENRGYVQKREYDKGIHWGR